MGTGGQKTQVCGAGDLSELSITVPQEWRTRGEPAIVVVETCPAAQAAEVRGVNENAALSKVLNEVAICTMANRKRVSQIRSKQPKRMGSFLKRVFG